MVKDAEFHHFILKLDSFVSALVEDNAHEDHRTLREMSGVDEWRLDY